MVAQIPGYTYTVLPCKAQEDSTCTSMSSLDYMINERWRNNLERSEALVKSILSGLGIHDRFRVSVGNSQVYIWAPPCLKAIEIALSLSMAHATVVRQIFTSDPDDERQYPTLPCQIRIDDRLSTCGPDAAAHKFKAREVLTYLKRCETNEHFPRGLSTLQLTPVQPGTWVADHFDIPYLERSQHVSNQQTAEFSVSNMMTESVRPGCTTGNVILADKFPFDDLLNHPRRDGNATGPNAGPGTLFKLARTDKDQFQASFIGAYRLIWPKTPWAEMANLYGKKPAYNKPTSPEETLSWKDLTGPDLKSRLKKVGFSKYNAFKKSVKEALEENETSAKVAQEEKEKRDKWNNCSQEEREKMVEESRETLEQEKRARSNIP